MIGRDEVEAVMKTMSTGKSPGADGFPVEFWRFFWDVVGGDFMEVVGWIAESGRVSESMSEGTVRLHFKKGDRMNVRNYRPAPVTLVNVDYKLVSRCVAGNLSSVLPGLVYKDQTGLPGCHVSTNLHVIRDAVEYCEREGIGGALVFLDQEKRFDRVDHDFAFKVLACYGFGGGFLRWVRDFYNEVISRVLVNGVFSNRQGVKTAGFSIIPAVCTYGRGVGKFI
jgi:hypothetical protein